MFDWLLKSELPNSFTIAMGDKLREARLERGFSQEELAQKALIRRPSLSNMETGKMEPSASELFMLSVILQKPVNYFFGEQYQRGMLLLTETEVLPPEEEELLIQFRQLDTPSFRRTAIQQLRQLVQLFHAG